MGIFVYWSCDLELDSMTFLYELDPYSLKIYIEYVKVNLLRKLSTDRQTYTTEIIYHAASRGGGVDTLNLHQETLFDLYELLT